MGDCILKRTDEEIIKLFYELSDILSVSDILEIDDRSLRYFLYSKNPDTLYTEFKLLKKNGTDRTILAPSPKLKNIQKNLAYILNLVYKPKSCAYGFIKNKNIINNAKQHVGRNLILNIDLKDFFTQIHFGRVRGMLSHPPYNIHIEAATTIAQLACHRGTLPQGAPSSPIITNMICGPLDNHLMKLCKKYRLRYSRYADDLTFSTYMTKFPSNIIDGEVNSLKLGQELNDILIKNNFNVNENKVFLNSNKKRQEVTGLVVNSFPNIKREYIKELRAILYDSRKNGLYNAAVKYIKKNKNEKIINRNNGDNFEQRVIQWFMEVLKGKINFLKQVRGEKDYVFLKYAKEFNDLFGIDLFDVSIIDELLNKVSKNIFIIKGINDNNMNQGSGFFVKGYGIFTNYHVTEDEDFYGVYKYDEPNKFIATISKGMNEKKSDKDIDYALYEYDKKDNNCFEIDVNGTLDIGDKVKIIGYPNYNEGDLPSIQTCEIISRKDNFFGAPLYIVGGRIVHGASGGPVLNSKDKIIGIIKGGIVSYEEEQDNHNQGFIPIDIVLKDLEKQKVLCSD